MSQEADVPARVNARLTDDAKSRVKAPLSSTLDPLLTVEETAAYLRMHKMTVYRMMSRGLIPYSLIGQRRKVRQSDLEALVEAGS